MRDSVLVILESESQFLLLEKLRGLGAGKWNFPGGKAEVGETPLQTAKRELAEETGHGAERYHQVGVLVFRFSDRPHLNNCCAVFRAFGPTGETKSSTEGRVFWGSLSESDYDRFWPCDRLWVPRILNGEILQGDFVYGPGDELLSAKINALSAGWVF